MHKPREFHCGTGTSAAISIPTAYRYSTRWKITSTTFLPGTAKSASAHWRRQFPAVIHTGQNCSTAGFSIWWRTGAAAWTRNMPTAYRRYWSARKAPANPLSAAASCRPNCAPTTPTALTFSRKRDTELYLNRFALINIDEFDQVSMTQQGFLKHILQKPVVNVRKPYANAVLEMPRYASFIATSNQKDLLTDPSGSRRFICIEVTDVIDTTHPIDYSQLYAQAMYELDHGERYWFDPSDERVMTENNRNFEQVPPEEQLFYRYFRAAGSDEGGGMAVACRDSKPHAAVQFHSIVNQESECIRQDPAEARDTFPPHKVRNHVPRCGM